MKRLAIGFAIGCALPVAALVGGMVALGYLLDDEIFGDPYA